MGSLHAFMFISLNGYYKGLEEDISWHRHGDEESSFASDSMEGRKSILVFGRKTYEQMAGWWPSPQALEAIPEVAAGMNESSKLVFSNTLDEAKWENTRLVKTDMVEEIKRLKEDPNVVMTILGSGSIVAQLADAGLIDTLQIMLDPVALSAGSPIFEGVSRKLDFRLTNSRVFQSGVVLLAYEPL